MSYYTVMSSGAKMPGNCWGIYRRVAVVEVEPGAEPKMISDRAKGVVRIVQTWERLHAGRNPGPRSAYGRALAEAQALADELNARDAA